MIPFSAIWLEWVAFLYGWNAACAATMLDALAAPKKNAVILRFPSGGKAVSRAS